MAEFTVAEILQATEGKAISMACQKFSGVCTDTRRLRTGELFIALVGERFDGNQFVAQALERGATGAVVSADFAGAVPPNTTIIKVNDTLQALQSLAALHRARFSVPVIAVTGSNGKTTTKDMIAAALSSRFPVLKTEANFNNEIGLPLTLLGMQSEQKAAVVEMGMRGRGEIAALAAIAKPNVAVITNVGETHMELLGSIENIAAAKSELLASLAENGLAILNGDDVQVRAMETPADCRKVYYGFNANAAVRAEKIKTSLLKKGLCTSFVCQTPNASFALKIPCAGRHNVYNALAAVAVSLELGFNQEEIQRGLQNFIPTAMRLDIMQLHGYTLINDAYNASPLSMTAALDTLAELGTGRKMAVLGDMLELGEMAVDAHRNIGKKAAAKGLEAVVTVGELAGHIAAAAKESGVNYVSACHNHAEAAAKLKEILEPDDTLLIKGSRGMAMEKIIPLLQN